MDLTPPLTPAPETGGPSPPGLDDAIGQAFGRAPALIRSTPNYDDDRALLALFDTWKRQCLDSRWVFERSWWQKLLYVLGRQWIYYDRRRGQWLDKRLQRWMPRPVTNKCSEAVEALLALFSAVKLGTLARPIGGAVANVAAAEVADEVQPFIHDEHAMDGVLRDADFWLIVTGNSFLHPCWDKDAESGTIVVPYERCVTCQRVWPPSQLVGPTAQCPGCGATTFEPAQAETGGPIADTLHTGRGRTDAVSPWEIAVPPIYTDFETTPVVLRMSWRPKHYYEQHYPDLASTLAFEKTPSERSLQLLRTLATQSDLSAMPLSFLAGGGQDSETSGLAEYELWLKPTRDYPEGLYLRVVGDGSGARVLRDASGTSPGPLPYQTRDNRPIFPWLHIPYQPVGGRLWARGPLDLAVQKQDQINQLDALIQMIVQRMANPIWLEPKGAEVRSFTGEPGLVVKYNALAASGAKPERIPGENVPPSLFQLRQQYLTDFEQLVGTYDVIKGAKPTGVEAFSALQLLVERSQSRFATVLAARGEAYRQWYQIALELERQYGPTERIVSVLSPNRGWTFRHFENAQLQGAIEIRVEDGSQAPKTNLGRRAAIEQANQLRLIAPDDPEQRYTILTSLGLSDLVQTLDYDVKSALQEQDAFEQWAAARQFDVAQLQQMWAMHTQQVMRAQLAAQQATLVGTMPAPPPPPPEMTPFAVKLYHEPAVHFAEHRKWANSDSAREIFQEFPILETFFTAHLQQHQQMMPSAMMPGPPTQGGAMERSLAESGNARDVPRGQGEGWQGRGPE